ncbi:MAG: ABC transporter ATP-binding protein [Aeromonadaceae bacterium]|nr:ABC transporter ATP-binding protein [Aeromonadaceae bacterium]
MIHFHNLTLGYDRHPVIHHLHGEVAAGSLLAVIGPNGGGKSTLLKGILGQLAPLGGEIQLGVAREEIGYLPQQSRIDRQFPITVREVVAMGLWRHCGLFGRLAHSQRARVDAALERVGLENMAESRLEALSGGQLQRALFARLWLQESRLMLLDEPFSAIDSQTTEDLLGLLHEWQQEGRTVLAVLHDMTQVSRHFPESLLLAREVIAWGETSSVVCEENLSRARRLPLAPDPQAITCHRN